MSKKRRIMLGIGFVEVVLAGLWLYLSALGSDSPRRTSPEFHAVVGQTMGGAMGLIAAIGIFFFIIAGKQDAKS